MNNALFCLYLLLLQGAVVWSVLGATSGPSTSPTCFRIPKLDIVWIIDGSQSMTQSDLVSEYEISNYTSKFEYARQFILNFTATTTMSSVATRQAAVVYSGLYYLQGGGPGGSDTFVGGTDIGNYSLLTSSVATSNTGFSSWVRNMSDVGYTTNTPNAINFTRDTMFTSANQRSGAFRIAILITDGYPTNTYGYNSPLMANQTEVAAESLRDEDQATFIFVRVGLANATHLYPPNWFVTIADQIYEVTSFEELNTLLNLNFLCLELTHYPTGSPIIAPSRTPTTSQPSGTPSTSQPSRIPTTSRPSKNPSTSQPSRIPTTSRPSKTPSKSPTKFGTSTPSTSPSSSPTGCIPGIVHCCVSFPPPAILPSVHMYIYIYMRNVTLH